MVRTRVNVSQTIGEKKRTRHLKIRFSEETGKNTKLRRNRFLRERKKKAPNYEKIVFLRKREKKSPSYEIFAFLRETDKKSRFLGKFGKKTPEGITYGWSRRTKRWGQGNRRWSWCSHPWRKSRTSWNPKNRSKWWRGSRKGRQEQCRSRVPPQAKSSWAPRCPNL